MIAILILSASIHHKSYYSLSIYAVLLLCLNLPADAVGEVLFNTIMQEKITISGYVEDVETGEQLIGAHIYEATSGHGTTTNEYGFFSLTLENESSYRIEASYIGYETKVLEIAPNENIQLSIQLTMDNTLETIEVVSEAITEDIIEGSKMGSIVVPIETIEALPALGGEIDIMRTLQLMPGVASGGEGASGIFVRGGSPDQNLVLLDGVPVYNASHLFGFLSIFNSDAINNMELIKGGGPARYGGRLSSVLDIRMKEGNMKRFAGRASISPVATKVMLEGPLIKDKMSGMITVRRTFLDLFLGRPKTTTYSGGSETTKSKYYFADFNGKINYKLSYRDRLYLSFYGGKDKFGNESEYISNLEGSKGYINKYETGLDWGNLIGAFRWNHLFSNKFFGNLTLHYSQYQLGVSNSSGDQSFEDITRISESSYGLNYESMVQDVAAKLDFSYVPSTEHYIRAGLSVTNHNFLPGASKISQKSSAQMINIDTTHNSKTIKANEFSAYVEDDFQVSDKLKMNVGFHALLYQVGQKTYSSTQPRMSARFKVHPAWALKGAYSITTQPLHLLTTSGVGLPTDLWISPTERIKPQDAWQGAFGITHLLSGGWDVSIEAYYKEMDNLVNYREGTSLLVSIQGIEDKVTFGTGTAKGVELLVRKRQGKTTGWFSYVLSKADRTFPDINFGKTFAYDNDRRHDLSISVVHQFSDKFRMSGSWVFTSGKPSTIPTRQFNGGSTVEKGGSSAFSSVALSYSGKNNYRLPNFHRLDISAGWYKQRKWGERSIVVGLYNAYSRANTFFISKGWYSEQDELKYKYKSVSLFPIIPGISYNIKF